MDVLVLTSWRSQEDDKFYQLLGYALPELSIGMGKGSEATWRG